MINKTISLTILVIILILNLFIFNVIFSHENEELNDAKIELIQIEGINTQLDEAVLLANKSKLITYDNIVNLTTELKIKIKKIELLFQENELLANYQDNLDSLSSIISKKMELLENFKSKNSIIRNSLNSINVIAKGNSSLNNNKINKLKLGLLEFKIYGDENKKRELTQLLDSLKNNLNSTGNLGMLFIHSNNIIETDGAVNQLIEEILNESIIAESKLIQNDITNISTSYLESIRSYLIIYIIINFSLFILLFFLFKRLKQKSFLLKDLNKNLEIKVHERTKNLDSVNAELKQFSYIATHDLKVPINNIEGYLAMLKEDIETEDEDILDSINWIEKSVVQAKKTIEDLTFVTKFKEIGENSERLEFDEIYKDTLISLNSIILQSNTKFDVDFSNCQSILFGKIGLKSIFQNLIGNAIKYRSPERSPIIKIRTSIENNYVLLTIEDNGLGMDLEKQGEKLFGLFKRIHTNAEGSGIGLYMIKSLIERKGGEINAESEVGKGTKFNIYLPLK